MEATLQKKVRRSAFAFIMTDAHNNVFGFAQDGYIYTYTDNSNTHGEAWLRMQRTGEQGKDAPRYFLYFADEAEPSAVVDKHNNIYDLEGNYIATLSRARLIVILLTVLLFVVFLSGLAIYLGGEAIMQTTAPFSDENTVKISLDEEDTSGGNKHPDKSHQQIFDIFGNDDEEEKTTEELGSVSPSKPSGGTDRNTNSTDRTTEKNTDKTTGKNDDKTTEKATDKTTDKVTDKTTTTTKKETTTDPPKGEADFNDLKNKRVIYPGLEGQYQFLVTNTGGVPLFYKLSFSEKNPYDIPLRFKLKQGKKYVVGGDNTWVTIDKLNTEFARIEKGEEIIYTLEWKWIELNDEHDTALGTAAVANYEFTVKVDFEAAY